MHGRLTARRRHFAALLALATLSVALLAIATADNAHAPAPRHGDVAAAAHRPAHAERFIVTTPSPMTIAGARVEQFVLVAPPAPTLKESLEAATVLAEAGLIATPEPSLPDALRDLHALAMLAAADPPAPEAIEPTATPAPRRTRRSAPAAPPPPPPTPTAVPPTPAPPPEPPPPPAPAAGYDAAYTQAVFDGVNTARAAHGLAPLAVDARLERAATDYALLMAEHAWFAHEGPDGSTLVTRAEAAGFPFDAPLGEVLAMGSEGWPPSGVVQAWLDSPGHRTQILGPYTRAGIGCVFSADPTGVFVRCAMTLAG